MQAPQRQSVLFVTRKWSPAVGGMETYSHRLTEELRQLADVDVAALPGRPDGQPPSALALLGFAPRVLARWFGRTAAPDVLHLGDMALWPLGLLSALTVGRTRVVLSAHGTDVGYHRRGGIKGALYGAYLRCGSRLLRGARVIANSRATEAAARETGWHNIRIVALATDMRAAPERAHDGAVLFAGRLIRRKGCSWFVREVLPLLPADVPLKVAGTGWDADEIAALRDPRVRYLGALPPAALAAEYARSLCTVVPNIDLPNGEFEGFGLVACEAAACGAVVLAARTGGLSEAVVEGTTGMLLEPGDLAAWAREIAAIAAWSEAERCSFVATSSAAARVHYAWDRVAHETLSAYGQPA
ncbi:MAG: glycosyltransferase family 4 protein [Tsuneonella sp.]